MTIIVNGTTFPVSPTTGNDFFRTDLGLWCVYDGTDWVTLEIYEKTIAEATYSGSANIELQWYGDVYQPKAYRFEVRTFVATTNTGSDYYSVFIRGRALDDSITIYSTITTAADSPDVFVDHGEAADVETAVNYGAWEFRRASTGSPGNLTMSATIKYRLIIT